MKKEIYRRTAALCLAIALMLLGACSNAKKSGNWKEDEPYQSYDLGDYVALGDYKGISIAFEPEEAKAITQAQISQYTKQVCISNGISLFKERKGKMEVANGDVVLFDFEGKAPGLSEEILAGMKNDEPQELEIGSDMFIPGFEEQMVGQKVGVPFDVNVTFPESYPNQPELENKPVTFHCTVHKIGSAVLNDAKIEELTQGEYKTIKAFEDSYVKPALEQEGKQAQDRNKQNALEAAYKNAEVKKVPEKEVEYYVDALKKMAEKNGQSVDDFLEGIEQYDGMEGFRKKMDDQVRREIFCYALAKQEKLEITEKELKARLDDLRGEDDTMTDDAIFKAQGGKGMLLRGMVIEKVMNFVYDNAVNTAQ